jgi:methionine-gamma-lyase
MSKHAKKNSQRSTLSHSPLPQMATNKQTATDRQTATNRQAPINKQAATNKECPHYHHHCHRFDTLAIHAGEENEQHHALAPPIYMTSTFTFDSLKEADDTFSFKRRAYVYTRGGNPTINLLERRLAALEGGVDGVAFASGMAAITGVLLSLVKSGEHILAHNNLYGSAYSAIKTLFANFGIKSTFVDLNNVAAIAQYITPQTKVIYLETPTNPALEVLDITAIAKIAHAHKIKVVVDNTFATPALQRPLAYGADVVLHSATKYLCGHGDAVGGIAVAKDEEYIAQLKFGYMCELGSVISPFNAWLILRGLKTLSLRMERHSHNAQAVADFLSAHSMVEKVIYPGLKSHPQHELANKQMGALYGGIISFEIPGDEKTASRCIEKMRLAKLAVSLGDAETLVELPALMTHRSYTDSDLHQLKFSKKTIRLSIGLENHLDIIADLQSALTLR